MSQPESQTREVVEHFPAGGSQAWWLSQKRDTSRILDRPTWLTSPEGDTSQVEDFAAIVEDIRVMLESADHEELEDGVETPLIPSLHRLVTTRGVGAVFELAGLIVAGTVDSVIASWILRWLGRIPHRPTHEARRWLLEKGLYSAVPTVRDGAALGLVSLGDCRSVPALRAAVDREQHYVRLRWNLEQALQQLDEHTR